MPDAAAKSLVRGDKRVAKNAQDPITHKRGTCHAEPVTDHSRRSASLAIGATALAGNARADDAFGGYLTDIPGSSQGNLAREILRSRQPWPGF